MANATFFGQFVRFGVHRKALTRLARAPCQPQALVGRWLPPVSAIADHLLLGAAGRGFRAAGTKRKPRTISGAMATVRSIGNSTHGCSSAAHLCNRSGSVTTDARPVTTTLHPVRSAESIWSAWYVTTSTTGELAVLATAEPNLLRMMTSPPSRMWFSGLTAGSAC